jgi:hypothetical protein
MAQYYNGNPTSDSVFPVVFHFLAKTTLLLNRFPYAATAL